MIVTILGGMFFLRLCDCVDVEYIDRANEGGTWCSISGLKISFQWFHYTMCHLFLSRIALDICKRLI